MKNKICILLPFSIIVLFILFFLLFKHNNSSPYRYTEKIKKMEQDQILLPAKNEVLDFFWRGYRPGKYPFLEKKSENLPSEIKPNISSNPVIISFFIEKKSF